MKFALQDILTAAISLHRFLKIYSCLFDCSFSSSINRYLYLFICVDGSIYLHVCVCACMLASVMSNSLQPYGLQPVRLPIHGIVQARLLEWVVMPFSRGSSQPTDQTHISYIFCIVRQVLYRQSDLGSPSVIFLKPNSLIFGVHFL